MIGLDICLCFALYKLALSLLIGYLNKANGLKKQHEPSSFLWEACHECK